MTVFTASSLRQISFQIYFFMKIHRSDTLTLLTVVWTDIHLYWCAFVILRDPPWRRPGDDWRQFSWRRTPVDRHSSKNYPEREKITFFFPSAQMILRLWKHILRRQREHAALVSCLFVGEIWAVSNEFLITEKGTHYHFCILSPFHSSSGFVSTKSAKVVFFPQFSSLVNQSGVTYVMSEWRNCWK